MNLKVTVDGIFKLSIGIFSTLALIIFNDMQGTMSRLEKSFVSLKVEMARSNELTKNQQKIISDHEVRIRILEKENLRVPK